MACRGTTGGSKNIVWRISIFKTIHRFINLLNLGTRGRKVKVYSMSSIGDSGVGI